VEGDTKECTHNGGMLKNKSKDANVLSFNEDDSVVFLRFELRRVATLSSRICVPKA